MIIKGEIVGEWQPWFAWRPVWLHQTETTAGRFAWLCRVERRRAYFALLKETVTSYRPPQSVSERRVRQVGSMPAVGQKDAALA